jgi:hypothetical protein
MTALRIYFDGERTGPLFRRSIARLGDRVRTAARGAAQDAAKEIVTLGRENMVAGGRFERWAQGLDAKVTEGGGNIKIAVTIDRQQAPWFWTFQEGVTIKGNPLLWIPLSFADVPKGTLARDYAGGLFRVDRKSGAAPLLLSLVDKKPKYFGKEQVVEPKKFRVVEITREVARRVRSFYVNRLKQS